MALALSHQEAAVLPFLCQQLFGLPARQVSVEPSDKSDKAISFLFFFNGLDGFKVKLKPEKTATMLLSRYKILMESLNSFLGNIKYGCTFFTGSYLY